MPPGYTVQVFGELSVNRIGGYAVTVHATDGVNTTSLVWGSVDGIQPGAPLFVAGTLGPLVQSGIGLESGLTDSGSVAYSVRLASDQLPLVDSSWVDQHILAASYETSSVAGKVWGPIDSTRVTSGGFVHVVGSVFDGSGSGGVLRGLFVGHRLIPLILSGDVISPFTDPVSTSFPVQDARFSGDASHHIAAVTLEDANGSKTSAIVLDDAGLVLGGVQVREGNVVPISIGGDGFVQWSSFWDYDVNGDGSYAICAGTSPMFALSLLVVDGQVRYRTGDVVDGVQIGVPRAVSIDPAGNVAFRTQGSSAGEGIFVNDQLAVALNEPIDVDGDGVVEPGTTVINLPAGRPQVDANGFLIYRAKVTLGGQFPAALIRKPIR